MPVQKEFLVNTLEECLEHKLEVIPLFEFLLDKIDCKNSSSQRQSLNKFIEKWKSHLYRNSKTTFIVNYKGVWIPPCSSRNELKKQLTYKKFIHETYGLEFQEGDAANSRNSQEYQPQNFNELVQLLFWKELYETVGHKTIKHIFEKCALLYEAHESLYLLIACFKEIIYRKLTKIQNERKLPHGNSSSNVAMANQENPYKLTLNNQQRLHKQTPMEVSERENSDPALFLSNSPVNQECRIEPVNSVNQEEIENSGPRINTIVQTKAINKSCQPRRWIEPKPFELEKIIKHRNETRLQYGISESSQYKPDLSYVLIENDDVFIPQDKLIVVKQNCDITVDNPSVPAKWDGLKLPKNLKAIRAYGSVSVSVYRISECLAKQFGIRIHPKKHWRRKSSNFNCFEYNYEQVNCSENRKSLPCPLVGHKTVSQENIRNNRKVLVPIRSKSQPNNQLSSLINKTSRAIIPFQACVTLPVGACLYNRSSWTKWPTSHSLSKAGAKINDNNEKGISAVRIVLDDILKSPTCSSEAHSKLTSILAGKLRLDTNCGTTFASDILKIIKTHTKFSDFHKLFKNCLVYWFSKYTEKERSKACKKQVADRKGTKDVDDGKRFRSNTHVIQTDIAEVVDLTRSPPSPSTNFSESNRVEVSEKSRLNTHVIQNDIAEIVDLTRSTPSTNFSESNRVEVSENSPKSVIVLNKKTSHSPRISVASPSSLICHPNTNADAVRKNGVERKLNKENLTSKKSFNSLKRIIPYNCVMQSLKHVFHIIKLDCLLGSRRNIRGFFRFVRKSIILGGTKSCLHLGELMALLNPHETSAAYFFGKGNELVTITFVAKLAFWLFNECVLVLLKCSLYITECSFSRLQLNFYLRESWTSASEKMKNHLIFKGALQEHGNEERENAVLRYMPKQNNSLRSLLLIRKSAWSRNEWDIKIFKLMLHYLDVKINKSRMYIQSTVQYEWRKFLSSWRNNGSPKLFYVRMDIRDAYPSVSTIKLQEILSSMKKELAENMVLKQYIILGVNGRKTVRNSVYDSKCRSNWHSGIHVRPGIALDLQKDQPINAWEILEQIVSVINKLNIVKVGKKYYQFSYGLPQGWGPSPILCNIYYGFMDSTLYSAYMGLRGRLFLRVVDDYLFITPYPEEVLELLNLMNVGCHTYDVQLNGEKSDTNVYVRSNMTLPSTSCDIVTFCGWNFCLTCGHVSRDYKKYINQDFCGTIRFQFPATIKSPEHFLRRRGTLIMAARIKSILVDPTINCDKRILLTLYEAAVLLSIRFYSICRVVYPSFAAMMEPQRVIAGFNSIVVCCERLARFVSRNCKYPDPILSSQNRVSCFQHCCGDGVSSNSRFQAINVRDNTCLLHSDILMYVALLGFIFKLKKHYQVFKHLIRKLQHRLSSLRCKLSENDRVAIDQIIGTKVPLCFENIF